MKKAQQVNGTPGGQHVLISGAYTGAPYQLAPDWEIIGNVPTGYWPGGTQQYRAQFPSVLNQRGTRWANVPNGLTSQVQSGPDAQKTTLASMAVRSPGMVTAQLHQQTSTALVQVASGSSGGSGLLSTLRARLGL